jgi:hypothetical protein
LFLVEKEINASLTSDPSIFPYEKKGILLGIPLFRHRSLRLSDGSELLIEIWCYPFIGGMKNPSHETAQQATECFDLCR